MEEGAAVGSIAGSATAISHWTAARRQAAEPLSVLTLAGDGPALRSASTGSTAGTVTTLAGSSTIEGVDTGESTTFPNRANGTVYGVYRIGSRREEYQCSGSVINSPQGDVVLTAGHCVIDPETGTVASAVVFVPGYRETQEPFGVWSAAQYATTEAWQTTVGTAEPNEGGDLALLVLRDNTEGKSVEETVGSLSIAFDQPRLQTYTEWGYPGESPYDGEVLYTNTAAYAGSDLSFSPAPIRIHSDFTGGSSGGPWTIGPTSAPTVVSLTDYGYEEDPKHIYGAYFGEEARKAYEVASGVVVPAGTEAGVPAQGASGETSTGTGSSSGGSTSGGTGSTGGTTTQPGATTTTTAPSVRIASVRRNRATGATVLLVAVSGPGTLRLSGSALRTASLAVTAAGTYRLPVVAQGSAARRLDRGTGAVVAVKITFSASGATAHVSRLVSLTAGSR